jgi:hypothetical protein
MFRLIYGLTEIFLTLTEVFLTLTEVFLTLIEVLLTLTEVFLNLTEGFTWFFLSCKVNAWVKLAKTGHGPHSTPLVCICVVRSLSVLFYVVLVCKCVLPPDNNPLAVNNYNISYHIISYSQTEHINKKLLWIFCLWLCSQLDDGYTCILAETCSWFFMIKIFVFRQYFLLLTTPTHDHCSSCQSPHATRLAL